MASEEVRISAALPVKRSTLNALLTLVIMVLGSQLIVIYQTYSDNQRVRKERTTLMTAPMEEWLEYAQVSPEKETTPTGPEGILAMRSSFATYQAPVTIEHEDVLRCIPIDPEVGTEERYINSAGGTITHKTRVRAGPKAPRSPGAKKVSGLWEYSKPLPTYEADCTMESNPCVWLPYGIKKCMEDPLISSVIRLRKPEG